MRSILFRCDAGAIPAIGTGHFARCLLLAHELCARGAEIAFVGIFDAPALNRLERAGLPYQQLGSQELQSKQLEAAVERWRPDVFVHDRLDSDVELMASIGARVPVVVTLDDLGPGSELADIVVNAIVGDGSEPYANYRYVVVPPLAAAAGTAHERPQVVLTFGGYDHGSIGRRVADAVRGADADVIWLAGPSGQMADAPAGVTVVHDAPNFGDLLATADAAVLAGGLTVFQALANGVPVIAVPQYDHQERTIQRLAQRGAVVPIEASGVDRVAEQTRAALDELLADPELRATLRRRALETVDG
ncbi:MAG: hypothetical protein M3O89_01670, partial [Actinomycetota bacterium]|nr:hypothetical protein [Actinomycetota bacterium]